MDDQDGRHDHIYGNTGILLRVHFLVEAYRFRMECLIETAKVHQCIKWYHFHE